MIDKIIYIALIAVLVYLYFIIADELRKQYYKKVPPGSILFFMALIFPGEYFKKDNLFDGYFLHVLSLVIILIALYLFGKVGGLI